MRYKCLIEKNEPIQPPTDKYKNLLHFDGTVNYNGQIWTKEQADFYLNKLTECIHWQNDEVFIFGKKITMERKVGWDGYKPFKYTYSNITKQSQPWTQELLELKSTIEKESGEN